MGIGFHMLGLTLVEPSLVNRVKLTALFVLTILSVSGPIIFVICNDSGVARFRK